MQTDVPVQQDVEEMQSSNEESAVPDDYILGTEKGGRLRNLRDTGMKILLPTLLIQLRVLSLSRLHIGMPSLAKNQ